ncbi:MAG: DUF1559 domain-containing protein [Planctomycetaceae bacterium]
MREFQRAITDGFGGRRGQMSTPALVFLILGIVFAAFVVLAIVGAALMLPAIQQARSAARTVQSKNNLKMIGLALHNYHDVYDVFPPGGIYTADDEPYSSWMTSLLPYVDQAGLYSRINQDQPWTSEDNYEWFEVEVPAYLHPKLAADDPETTHVNGLGAAHYAANSQLLRKNTGTPIRYLKDGTSNTLMAGEVSSGFMAWGDPANLRDPAAGIGSSPNQFGGVIPGGGAMMLMADGSVRVIGPDVAQDVLRRLADPNDGEAVGDF